MIIIQGAMISPTRYLGIANKIQEYIPNMAISIPSFFANMPLPPFLGKIDIIISEMKKR